LRPKVSSAVEADKKDGEEDNEEVNSENGL